MKPERQITLQLFRESMPGSVSGMCSDDGEGRYTVLINADLTAEEQMKAFLHEMCHVWNNDHKRESVAEIEQGVQEEFERFLLPLPF